MQSNPNQLSEDKLLALLLRKDQQAFKYLYEHYSGALYGLILNIVRQEERAGEVLQDVFMKIWNHLEAYQPEKARLFTWMARIARNAAIDAYRQQQQKKQQPHQGRTEPLEQTAGSYTFFEEGIGMDKVLRQLQEDQRKVVQLLYFQGYTQHEAAEELQIPLGTVKSRLRLAIHKLRNFFNP